MLETLAFCHSPKGYDIFKQTRSIRVYSHDVSHFCVHSHSMPCSYKQNVRVPSHGVHYRIRHRSCAFGNFFEGRSSLTSSISGQKVTYFSSHRLSQSEGFRTHATIDVAGAIDVINDLGLDTLTFLAVTVFVVPAFKIARASPILGFFFAGIVLNQLGVIRNLTDVKVLSEWGILFLLFEMGLELSLARLKALAKFAFGMGLTQVVLSTLAFTAFELPPNAAIGTRILEFLFHSRPDLFRRGLNFQKSGAGWILPEGVETRSDPAVRSRRRRGAAGRSRQRRCRKEQTEKLPEGAEAVAERETVAERGNPSSGGRLSEGGRQTPVLRSLVMDGDSD